MAKLCAKCKRKMDFCGLTLRGYYGREMATYWCDKCHTVYIFRIKDIVSDEED